MAAVDFARFTTEGLLRLLSFHENDRGTMTADEECRRMVMIEGCTKELHRRGCNVQPGEFLNADGGDENGGVDL